MTQPLPPYPDFEPHHEVAADPAYRPSAPDRREPPAELPAESPAAEDGPRRRAWLPLAAAGVAGLVIGAVGTAVVMSDGSSSSARTASTPLGSSSAVAGSTGPGPTSATNGKSANAKAHGVRGVITAENGSTWTVRSAAGPTVTVTVTTKTKFGTKKAAAARSDFMVHSAVTVLGARTGDHVTARRLVMARTGQGAKAPTASPTS